MSNALPLAMQRIRSAASQVGYGLKWAARDRARHFSACMHRATLRDVLFVGITGSAGKTTTKDLVAAILGAKGPCRSSAASLNDHELVDKTVLSTRRSHRYSVVEMSASGPGYLDRSLRAVRPDIGVLTAVAVEHYAAYRNVEAVAAEKRKIVDRLGSGAIAVLNRDDPFVRAIGESRTGPVLWVGRAAGSDLRLLDLRSRWPEPLTMTVEYEGDRYEFATRLHGVQSATPVLCALGVALAAGVPPQEAINVIARTSGPRGRMQIERLSDGVTFVRDDFKAPQWSFQAPLDFLRDAMAEKKIVVIGTISDSANEARRRYAKAARSALEVADLVLLVGSHTIDSERAKRIRDDGSLQLFPSVRLASEFLKRILRAGDLVLLKGTNKADHLERIVLDRLRPVQCWESSCRLDSFCSECTRAHARSRAGNAPSEAISAPSDGADIGRKGRVVVGLGNPGDRFLDTAHNVGQQLLDRIVEEFGGTWAKCNYGWEARCTFAGAPVVLVKLDRPMNHSGEGLRALLVHRNLCAADCIIVLDDADLPLGSARVRHAGGDAGHRGMRSIIEALGTDRVERVRIGVTQSGDRLAASEFVLKRLEKGNETILSAGLDAATRLLHDLTAESR